MSQKNEPTLASCSFDKRGLILIILGKQHEHTFKNYMHIQLTQNVLSKAVGQWKSGCVHV